MIYSITLFFNEIDLLDLKIQEESPCIDKIVIAESKWTHQGKPKPLNFPVEKYKNNEKILYLPIEDETYYTDCNLQINRHSRAIADRNYPQTKLSINDDDIIIVTDLDEIINGNQIEKIVTEAKKHEFVRLDTRLFCYYINVWNQFQSGGLTTNGKPANWAYPCAMTGKKYKTATIDNIRTFEIGPILPNCGNHFTSLGGAEKVAYKLQSYSHVEFNSPKVIAGIRKRIENLEDIAGRHDQQPLVVIAIDDKYPKTILNNLEEWQKYMYNKEMHND
jgi:beta-1,4-mannosyl-glycoprotein beta-1,4-N-acetylglucosaminyltransferase